MTLIGRGLLALALCTAGGCAARAVAANGSPERPDRAGCAGVPAVVPLGWTVSPDSAAALFAPENMVGAHPRRNGPYPRDLVVVGFHSGASVREKRAALRAVDGCVVGGDGTFLYVRVRNGGEDVPVWWARDELVRLPQVSYADPIQLHWAPAFDPGSEAPDGAEPKQAPGLPVS